MKKSKGHVVEGLTFPTLRRPVEDVADWRWYAVEEEGGVVKLVRRLGERVAEISRDGDLWRWMIFDGKQSALMRGLSGLLIHALTGAEQAQPYKFPPCAAWCHDDHTSERVTDSRFHEIGEEVTVSEGRRTATVSACLSTGPDPDDVYGPVVYVGGLGDCDLTVVEAQVLREALARAIGRAEDAQALRDRDDEQRRQCFVQQRTSLQAAGYGTQPTRDGAGRSQAA